MNKGMMKGEILKEMKGSPRFKKTSPRVKCENVEAHACNPSYSGGRDWRILIQGQLRQKVIKTHLDSTQPGYGSAQL
jgi:hypothetical protein